MAWSRDFIQMADELPPQLRYKRVPAGGGILNNRTYLILAATLAALLAGCGGADPAAPAQAESHAVVAEPAPVTQTEPYTPPAVTAKQELSALARGERPMPTLVKLQAAASQRPAAGRAGVPLQIGIGRELPDTASAAALKRALHWQRGSRGSAAAMRFISEGAQSIRLGLLVRKLPAGAVVRGYAQSGPTLFEVSGSAILALLQANQDAGDTSDEGRTWWSPLMESPDVTLEIELPAGASPDDLEVAVPRLSHVWEKPSTLDHAKRTSEVGDSGSCNIDVNCTSTYDAMRNSVAKMVFTDSGSTYLCTGTLLSNTAQDATPYFLSANHCISTQTVASTLQTYWFFRSSSCNSGVASSSYRTLTGGATLLYRSSATDTSFMRLASTPPTGAVYAGWSVAPVNSSTILGVHHPSGDLMKGSSGTLQGYSNCDTNLNCSNASISTGGYLRMVWSQGTTEAGSSGSGLFATVSGGSARYVVGTLFGGGASCTYRSAPDVYGRLDTPYYATGGLSQWLNPAGRTALFRFYNGSTGAHFYTLGKTERDSIIANNAAFSYEGIGFYAYPNAPTGSSPVYRFYNTVSGRHFYTISAAERDNVMATMPSYRYEGVSWYAQAGAGGTATALYRFYNGATGTHFYTLSPAERDGLIANSASGYAYEGIAYYAWVAP